MKGNGRRKIEIEPLEDPYRRQYTFTKRKRGLLKKASDLSILCGCEVAVVLFSPSDKPYSFGHPNLDDVVATNLLHHQDPNNNNSNDEEALNEGNKTQLEDLQEMHESIMVELRCKIKERLNEMEVAEALVAMKEQPALEFNN